MPMCTHSFGECYLRSSLSVSKGLDQQAAEISDGLLFSNILLFLKKGPDTAYTLKGSILLEHLNRVSQSDKGEVTMLGELCRVLMLRTVGNMLNLTLWMEELPNFSLGFSSTGEVELWEEKLRQVIDRNTDGTT